MDVERGKVDLINRAVEIGQRVFAAFKAKDKDIGPFAPRQAVIPHLARQNVIAKPARQRVIPRSA